MKGLVGIIVILIGLAALGVGGYVYLNQTDVILSPPLPIPLANPGEAGYDCSGADECFNTTAEHDTRINIPRSNMTTETDRYNQSEDNAETDFPYANKDANLVSYLRFTAGDILSDETGNYDATSTTADFTASGIFGGALDYELANSDFTQLGQDLYETNNTGSISIWIKPETVGVGDAIFSSSVATSNTNILSLQTYTPVATTYIVVQHYTGAGNNYLVHGDTAITSGNRYNVVLTQDGVAFKIYVNGHLESLTPVVDGNTGNWFNDLPAGTHDVRLGRRQRSGDTIYFDGIEDEYKYSDDVWTLTEVQERYNNGKQYIDTNWGSSYVSYNSPAMTVPAGQKLKNLTINTTSTGGSFIDNICFKPYNLNLCRYFNDTNYAGSRLITFSNISDSRDYSFDFINSTLPNWNFSIGIEGDGDSRAVINYVYLFYDSLFPAEPPIVDIILPLNISYFSGSGFWRNVSITNVDGSWCGVSINDAPNITMMQDGTTWWYWISNPPANYRDIYCCNSTADYGAVMNCSANVNYTIETMTSLYAVEFEINDTTFASTDYTEIFATDFNTSTSETFGLMSSFNLQKLTGGGTSVVSARVYIDSVLQHQENVRTVTNNNRQGSTGLNPLTFNLTGGEHNISFEFARTGNGNVEISNIDFVLGKFNTTAGYLVRGQLTNVSYTFESTEWSNGFNWTIDKTINSQSYHGGKLSVRSTAQDNIWLNFTNLNTTASSRNSLRHITGVLDLGSVGLNFINKNESESHNMTIGSRNVNGETITVTGSVFDFDLRDTDGNYVNSFQANNTTFSEQSPMIISGADYQLIDEGFIRMWSGNSLFISTTVSFNSSSSFHTASFKINVSNSTDGCESNKERYLSSNDDMGNMFMYVICDSNLLSQQNFTIHLWGASQLGETIQISSESLSALEVTNFSLSELPVPPSITIESPDERETSNDIWFNVSTNQDNTDLCWLNLDGNTTHNSTMTNETGNWYNLTEGLDDGIHFVHFYCNNTDGLTGETDDWYFSINLDELDFGTGIAIGMAILVFTLFYLFIGFRRCSSDLLTEGFKLLFIGLGLSMMVLAFGVFTEIAILNTATDLESMMETFMILMMSINAGFIMIYVVFAFKYVFEMWRGNNDNEKDI